MTVRTQPSQIPLSDRVSALKPSSTLAISAKARGLKDQGIDVLSFATGEPDFTAPEPVIRATVAALEAGETHYGPVPGDPETRTLIAGKLQRENGIEGLTPDHVIVTVGGKHAVHHVAHALLDPPQGGEAPDEVVIPTPAWVSYAPVSQLAGGRVVEVPTRAEDDFLLTPEQLDGAITERTRLLFLNSPSNPCGTMYTEAQLCELARVIAEAAESRAPDLVVLSDELYEKIIYGGIPHFSIGSVPEIAERVVTLGGMSKAWAMTGFRVGYLACPGEFGGRLIGACRKLQSQSTTCIATFVLPAVRAALTQCDEQVEEMRRAFERRAGLIYERMRGIPGLVCPKPTGAFYVFPDVSAHFAKRSQAGTQITSAETFASALLTEHHVACVPGEDFGAGGERCCRFSFACADAQIEEGMKRLGEFVAGLS